MRVLKKLLTASATAGLLLAAAAVSPAQDYQREIDKQFEVTPGGTLHLDADLGTVAVKSHSASRVEVHIEQIVRNADEREANELLDEIELDLRAEDGDVWIRADVPEWSRRRWFRGNRLWMRFEITVPENYNLDLKTSGGKVAVEEVQGDVNARTSGGSLHFTAIEGDITGRTSGGSVILSECTGQIRVRTSGGSIKLEEVEGDVTARTSGGSIRVARARGKLDVTTSGGSIRVEEMSGNVNASTSGGTIRVELAEQPREDCRLTTSGGSIYVYADPEMKFSLDAATSGGSVNSDLPVTVKGKIGKHRIRGAVNGGGPLLYLRTSGGSIYLKQK